MKGNTDINMKTINIINKYSTITIQYYYKKVKPNRNYISSKYNFLTFSYS